jgi:hypothetical protein
VSQSDHIKLSGYGGDAHAPAVVPPDDRSPPELDKAILRAAHAAVECRWYRLLPAKLRPVPGSGWQLLLASVVGLLAGLAVDAFLNHELWRGSAALHPHDAPLGGARTRDAGRAPQHWLQGIAALVQQGRLNEAAAELAAFEQHYPDFAKRSRK